MESLNIFENLEKLESKALEDIDEISPLEDAGEDNCEELPEEIAEASMELSTCSCFVSCGSDYSHGPCSCYTSCGSDFNKG